MALTLTTHDTRFDEPDAATIAKVLGSLDGGRNVVATLERSELVYLQAEGSADTGFALEYQDGSLDRRYRSRDRTLPLGQVGTLFQTYARDDAGWRDAVAWEHAPYTPAPIPWFSTWWAYVAAIFVVAALIWWWRK